jgi:hypothetical protein
VQGIEGDVEIRGGVGGAKDMTGFVVDAEEQETNNRTGAKSK